MQTMMVNYWPVYSQIDYELFVESFMQYTCARCLQSEASTLSFCLPIRRLVFFNGRTRISTPKIPVPDFRIRKHFFSYELVKRWALKVLASWQPSWGSRRWSNQNYCWCLYLAKIVSVIGFATSARLHSDIDDWGTPFCLL